MSDKDEILEGIGERLRRLHEADCELPEVMRKLLEALEKAERDASSTPSVANLEAGPLPNPDRT